MPMTSWILLFALGAYHGLNPAMGWLFAVALGLQDRTSRSVLTSLLPLATGHLVSVAAVLGIANLITLALPLVVVRILIGIVLISFAAYRLWRRRHTRWVGMRVGSADLALWSFLMASAHGAGLMLLPFVMKAPPQMMAESHHHLMLAGAMPVSTTTIEWWFPIGIHTAGYLLVTALVALVVYHKLGVEILRKAWFNFDYLWIAALAGAGILTLLA
jgi:hypothetical protein